MVRAAILILALGAVGAGAARAQEAIATAQAAAPPAPAAGATPPPLPERPRYSDEGPLPVGPCGNEAKVVDGEIQKPDHNPHGEVFAGVGTHGYREGGAVVCLPLGDTASLTVAVDAARIGHR
jgi:hypothetical protein